MAYSLENDYIKLLSFQTRYCDIVNIPCPDEDDFNKFDKNGDGLVCKGEYQNEGQ